MTYPIPTRGLEKRNQRGRKENCRICREPRLRADEEHFQQTEQQEQSPEALGPGPEGGERWEQG